MIQPKFFRDFFRDFDFRTLIKLCRRTFEFFGTAKILSFVLPTKFFSNFFSRYYHPNSLCFTWLRWGCKVRKHIIISQIFLIFFLIFFGPNCPEPLPSTLLLTALIQRTYRCFKNGRQS